MFRRILVPLDGSPASARMLDHARPLLAEGGEVTLLRVAPAGERDAATRELEALGRTLRTRVVVREGDPATAILKAAEAVDLVAMSTHGRSGLQRLTRGSVAEAVLRAAPVPLLLANPRALERAPGRPARLLVPLDGGLGTAQVLALVQALVQAAASEGPPVRVRLLRVEPMTFTEVPSPMVVPPWDPEEVKRSIAGARDALAAVGLEVEVAATFGFEAQAITTATEEADLVVMGTSGRRGLLRLVQGSVAEEVLRHAACPVLVRRFVEDL